jgi:hypothetical protein
MATVDDVRALGCELPRSYEVLVKPRPSDLRYNWIGVRLGAISPAEARELALEGWCYKSALPGRGGLCLY